MAKQRMGGKKSKRKDDRPARIRYWLKRQLEKKKIRNLMRYCKMSQKEAYKFWREHPKCKRKGRVNFSI